MMDRLELKAAFAVDDLGAITGLASVFGSADMGGDIVHKGAFAGAAPPLPMLASHDDAQAVGVWESLVETTDGLQVKGRLLVAEVARAAEVRALIRAGAMTGLSIGYVATKSAPRKGGGRDLFAVKLMEVSVVAVPMHPGARIVSAKAQGAGKVTMPDNEENTLQEQIEAAVIAATARIEAEAKTAGDAMEAKMIKLEAKMQRGGGDDKKAEASAERKAWGNYLRHGERGLTEAEKKAFSVSPDGQGGYLAPPEVSGEILRDMIEYSPIRELATVVGTMADSMVFITRGLLSGATWHGEQVTVPETGGNPLGQVEIPVRQLSTFVDISNRNLADAPLAEAEVRMAIAEDFGKKESVSFINGAGVIDPEGLMTNTEIATYQSAASGVMAPDDLIKFLYSMPMTYRNKGTFIMNGTTLSALRTLKDTTNQYLWQPALQAGQPETFLGRPVVECIDMPNATAGLYPILYGDFSGYRIVDRMQMGMLVDPYSQATLQRTRYHSTRRVGARVTQAFKFRKFQVKP